MTTEDLLKAIQEKYKGKWAPDQPIKFKDLIEILNLTKVVEEENKKSVINKLYPYGEKIHGV